MVRIFKPFKAPKKSFTYPTNFKEHITLFTWFVVERHNIDCIRLSNEKYIPEDPLLPLCISPYRLYDSATAALRDRLEGFHDTVGRALYWRIGVFRMFGRIETFDALQEVLENWNEEDAKTILKERQLSKLPVFASSTHFSRNAKNRSAIEVGCENLSRLNVQSSESFAFIRRLKSLEDGARFLTAKYPGIKKGVAYDIVCDLYQLTNFYKPKDIYTWANINNSVKKSLNRIFSSTHNNKDSERGFVPADYQKEMLEILKIHLPRNAPMFSFMPKMDLNTVQRSLIGFEKYCAGLFK